MFLLKLNGQGAYQWHTFLGSAQNTSGGNHFSGDDFGTSVALDSAGGVYVLGQSGGPWLGPQNQAPLRAFSGTTGYDVTIVKLLPEGDYQWHAFYGAADQSDYTFKIATDTTGGVYATGIAVQDWAGMAVGPRHAYSAGEDVWILKLDSNGIYQWHTFYGGTGTDDGTGIQPDGRGGVYITGCSDASWAANIGTPLHAFSGSGGSSALFVLKLTANGEYQWHTFYGFVEPSWFVSVATDSKSDPYIVATTTKNWLGEDGTNALHAYAGGSETTLLKLDGQGAYQWHTFYGSSAWDYPGEVAVDPEGNLFVTGESTAAWLGDGNTAPIHAFAGSADTFILKLNNPIVVRPFVSAAQWLKHEPPAFVLSWAGQSGWRYSVEKATNLQNAMWSALPEYSGVPGVDGNMSCTNVTTETNAYYRVVLQPPL